MKLGNVVQGLEPPCQSLASTHVARLAAGTSNGRLMRSQATDWAAGNQLRNVCCSGAQGVHRPEGSTSRVAWPGERKRGPAECSTAARKEKEDDPVTWETLAGLVKGKTEESVHPTTSGWAARPQSLSRHGLRPRDDTPELCRRGRRAKGRPEAFQFRPLGEGVGWTQSSEGWGTNGTGPSDARGRPQRSEGGQCRDRASRGKHAPNSDKGMRCQ